MIKLPHPTVLTLVSIGLASALLSHALLAQSRGPAGTLVISNMNDHTATLIDASTGRVRATLPTGEGPHEVAISNDGRVAAVSNYGVRGKPGNTITLIDVERAVVARTLTLGGSERPHGMAFLPGDTLIAVTLETRQAVLMIHVQDGRVVATLPTRGRGSHMLSATRDGARIVTGNIADGTVSVLDTRGRDSARVVPSGRQPEAIAIAPDGRTAWAGSNRDSLVVVLDLERNTAIDTVRAFGMPYRIAITPDARTTLVTDPVKGEIRAFVAATRQPKFTIAVPRDSVLPTAEVPGSPSPEGLAVSRDSRWAYVTLQGRNRVVWIDIERGTITAYAPTGVWSDGIGYSPVTMK